MPCFHLEKGARFLRMENLKNRSATGIAGRCDRAERHKRRLPLFLQSLRNGSGHPKSRHFPSKSQIPRTQKSRVPEDPASFICVQQIPLRIWLYRATRAAFSTVGVSAALLLTKSRHRGNSRHNGFSTSSWWAQDLHRSPAHRIRFPYRGEPPGKSRSVL